MIKEILDTLESITKSKLKYLILIFFVCLVLFPFIDKLFIKSYIIEQKMNMSIKYSELLASKYDSDVNNKLLLSIEKDINDYLKENTQEYSPIQSMKSNLGKFISGTILWIIVLILMIFSKEYTILKKILPLITIIILGFISGYLSSIIPIIIHPVINYIGYNILELLLIYSIIPKKKAVK